MHNLSYWETNTYFTNIDFAIVGSGIVGLNAAIHLKKKYPKAKVVVFERGFLPSGASTKNAGFACFGSIGELLEDINHNGEDACLQLVEMRWKGLLKLRTLLGDEAIDFRQYGGFEVFTNMLSFQECACAIDNINQLLYPIFNKKVFKISTNKISEQGLAFSHMIENELEGQIDTGKMMSALIGLACSLGVLIVNSCFIDEIQDDSNKATLLINNQTITAGKLIIATNGFAKQFLPALNVEPARAQVLVTSVIKNLPLKGTFHYQQGYYYFRNINDRVLFGGGRNLDIDGEHTTAFGLTDEIQQSLEQILPNYILPNTHFTIEQRWSGIMGLGNEKKPIIKPVGNNIVYAVRMGGMGVAIGSLVGEEAATLISS